MPSIPTFLGIICPAAPDHKRVFLTDDLESTAFYIVAAESVDLCL